MVYFGSEFYQNNFYQACVGNGDPQTPAGQLCGLISPLRAQKPVQGFPYNADRDSDASRLSSRHRARLPHLRRMVE